MGARGTTAALGEGAAEMAEAREFGSVRQLKSGRWQARYPPNASADRKAERYGIVPLSSACHHGES